MRRALLQMPLLSAPQALNAAVTACTPRLPISCKVMAGLCSTSAPMAPKADSTTVGLRGQWAPSTRTSRAMAPSSARSLGDGAGFNTKRCCGELLLSE